MKAVVPTRGGYEVSSIDQLAVDTVRVLSIEGVEKANSGHPGMPLGAAPMAHVVWSRHLRFDPHHPEWPDRDRFVLSAGHGSMLLYSLLHLAGYDLPMDELRSFRQWGSRTPGHPEHGLTPGVEVTTGPLGQGFANGVGMAVAESFLRATFTRPGHDVVDHRVYAVVSDGDLMEGVASEAASLAGHLGLGRLIYLYDDNHISIEGSTELAFTEDVALRFQAYGWHVQRVEDGNDLGAIDGAVTAAKRESDRPSLIMVRTHIGYGSPHKQDSADAHGSPLGADEVRLTKAALGWTAPEEFFVPGAVRDLYAARAAQGAAARAAWLERMAAYEHAYPEEAETLRGALAGEPPAGWEEALPEFPAGTAPLATRAASGTVLNALASRIPTLLGGSADLAPSNNTHLKACGETPCGDFQKETPGGRNLHFGVREHAMGGILNGMALHGGVFPYGGTFLVFSDYMRPSIRLAALSQARVTYVFTHDSVGLGEDGPTHQPVEHLAALRVIPNLLVIRPGDASETVVAWKVALERRDGPVALILTRQNLPVLDRSILGSAAGLARGGYVLAEASGGAGALDAVILATGSEVAVALVARDTLEGEGLGVRVVSLPSWELFEAQDAEYREAVLPSAVRARVAVEAATSFGWRRWVGDAGAVVGIDRFGASAPGPVVLAQLGITPEHVAETVRQVASRRG
ncbi:MAG: transketolase [Thermoleophilia bacterium]